MKSSIVIQDLPGGSSYLTNLINRNIKKNDSDYYALNSKEKNASFFVPKSTNHKS